MADNIHDINGGSVLFSVEIHDNKALLLEA